MEARSAALRAGPARRGTRGDSGRAPAFPPDARSTARGTRRCVVRAGHAARRPGARGDGHERALRRDRARRRRLVGAGHPHRSHRQGPGRYGTAGDAHRGTRGPRRSPRDPLRLGRRTGLRSSPQRDPGARTALRGSRHGAGRRSDPPRGSGRDGNHGGRFSALAARGVRARSARGDRARHRARPVERPLRRAHASRGHPGGRRRSLPARPPPHRRRPRPDRRRHRPDRRATAAAPRGGYPGEGAPRRRAQRHGRRRPGGRPPRKGRARQRARSRLLRHRERSGRRAAPARSRAPRGARCPPRRGQSHGGIRRSRDPARLPWRARPARAGRALSPAAPWRGSAPWPSSTT